MSVITLSNLSGAISNTNYTDPATALQVVGQVPIPNYARQLRISPNGITFYNGTDAYTVAIPVQEAWNVAINASPNLSYLPFITLQPSPVTVTHPAAASFQVAVQSEFTPSYQWKVNSGGGYVNSTGGVYSNDTTNTLNISNSTGLNQYNYECVITNLLGITTSANVKITVL